MCLLRKFATEGRQLTHNLLSEELSASPVSLRLTGREGVALGSGAEGWGLNEVQARPCSRRNGRRLPGFSVTNTQTVFIIDEPHLSGRGAGRKSPICLNHLMAGDGSRMQVYILHDTLCSHHSVRLWITRSIGGVFQVCPVSFCFADLDFSQGGSTHCHIVHFGVIAPHECDCACVCACVSHACPCQGLWVLHLCSPYFRGDDKGREMSFL